MIKCKRSILSVDSKVFDQTYFITPARDFIPVFYTFLSLASSLSRLLTGLIIYCVQYVLFSVISCHCGQMWTAVCANLRTFIAAV